MIDKLKRPGAIIYDANGFSPYGREIAGILLQGGHRITLIATKRREWNVKGIRTREWLGRSLSDDGLTLYPRLRLFGPIKTVLLSAVTKEPLVIAWSRDAWDALVFGLAASLGLRLIVVHHNPIDERLKGGIEGRIFGWLLKHARPVVVHSDELADSTSLGNLQVRVAPHPPCIQFRAAYPSPPTSRSEHLFTILFLGNFRPDKGLDQLPDIVGRIDHDATLLVAGRGELPESLVNSCAKFGVQLEHVGSGEELSDSDIAAALDRADVLLAPYRNVTESASALVAMAWGLPTLGYSSGALVRLLNNKSRVAVNDSIALAERLEKFRLRPWPTYQETLDALTIKCIAGWGAILAAAAEGSSAPSKK